MKKSLTALATLVMGFALTAQAEEAKAPKSGLDVGERPPAFYVSDVTGPRAGEKLCYRCQYGGRPVVSIFARKMDDNVQKLVKEIDGVVDKNSGKKMAAFVVLLTDDPDGAETQLKKAAKQHKIAKTPLTVFDGKAGPKPYKLAKDADVTVMMWVDSEVKVSQAFAKKSLNADSIKSLVDDTQKILN